MPQINFKKNFWSLFLLVVLPLSGYTQTQGRQYIYESGVWNGAYLKLRISDKLAYYGEHHIRFRNSPGTPYNFAGQLSKNYNRFGINILFNDKFEAVIGPTLVLNFSPDPKNPGFEKRTLEPRIWHQWLFMMSPIGRVKFYHQFRFEHRWRRQNDVGAEYQYTNRYRYKIFAYIPLNSPKIKPKTLYFYPSTEIFLHSGKNIVSNPMEDFRTYNGFGYVYNQKITFFMGYQYSLGQLPTGYQYRINHVLRFNVFIGLDVRRIENRIPSINIGY